MDRIFLPFGFGCHSVFLHDAANGLVLSHEETVEFPGKLVIRSFPENSETKPVRSLSHLSTTRTSQKFPEILLDVFWKERKFLFIYEALR
jgi:hypothetical protein